MAGSACHAGLASFLAKPCRNSRGYPCGWTGHVQQVAAETNPTSLHPDGKRAVPEGQQRSVADRGADGLRSNVAPQPVFVVAKKCPRLSNGDAVRQGQGRGAAGLRHPQDHAARARVASDTDLDRRLANADGVGHPCRPVVRPAGAGRG